MCGTASRDARTAGNSVWSNASCHSASVVSTMPAPLASADVVDEDVEAAERLDRARDHVGDALVGGQIGLNREDTRSAPPGSAAELRGGVGQPLFAARADRHAAAFAEERPGGGQPEPCVEPVTMATLSVRSRSM